MHIHFLFGLHSDAGGHSEGSSDGGKHGDENVEDFTPKLLVFHRGFEL